MEQHVQHSTDLATEVLAQSRVLADLAWPRFAEFTVIAKVSSPQEYSELFDWAAGAHGGPLCKHLHSETCGSCDATGLIDGAPCLWCEGSGTVHSCEREHYATAQLMTDGMSAWEWELRSRLQGVLAMLEAGDHAGARDALAAELAGFEPLLDLS